VKPILSYNLNQVCKYVGDEMEVIYMITNEDNETLDTFAEDQAFEAQRLWWSYLTDDERQLWDDYQVEYEVEDECQQQDSWERICLGG
jgi:hypothetical protein